MDPFLTPPEVFVKNYLNSYQQCPSRSTTALSCWVTTSFGLILDWCSPSLATRSAARSVWLNSLRLVGNA